MVEKATVKVLFSFDEQGWIIGYQSEFFDGTDWQTPFDVTNAVDVAPADLANICLGASEVSSDGTITTDADKKAELEAEANKPEPSPEDKIAALQQSNDSLQSALLELSDIVLQGGGSK